MVSRSWLVEVCDRSWLIEVCYRSWLIEVCELLIYSCIIRPKIPMDVHVCNLTTVQCFLFGGFHISSYIIVRKFSFVLARTSHFVVLARTLHFVVLACPVPHAGQFCVTHPDRRRNTRCSCHPLRWYKMVTATVLPWQLFLYCIVARSVYKYSL